MAVCFTVYSKTFAYLLFRASSKGQEYFTSFSGYFVSYDMAATKKDVTNGI